MSAIVDDDIPYLLLTPGPLTTSRTVREAMMRDYCTWDDDYNSLVNEIRSRLVALASEEEGAYTAVLMQGSGTFAVEATIGSVVPPTRSRLSGSRSTRLVRLLLLMPCHRSVDCQ